MLSIATKHLVFSNLLPGNDSFVVIRCNGNVISDPLLSIGRLLRLHHSGFQSSCHNVEIRYYFTDVNISWMGSESFRIGSQHQISSEVASYTHLTSANSTTRTRPLPPAPQIVLSVGKGRITIGTFRINGECSRLLISLFILSVFRISLFVTWLWTK
jgi:hypothetical protein